MCRREVFPDGILYASRESHYSVFKAARMYRMDCVKVDTLVTGEIDCADFKAKLLPNKDKPAILNVNIGISVFFMHTWICTHTHTDIIEKRTIAQPFISTCLLSLQELLSKEPLMILILSFRLLKNVDSRMIDSTSTVMELYLGLWCHSSNV